MGEGGGAGEFETEGREGRRLSSTQRAEAESDSSLPAATFFYFFFCSCLGMVQLDHPALTPYLNLDSLKEMVEKDKKGRLALVQRPSTSASSSAEASSSTTPTKTDVWYIRANQGHSIKLEGIEDGMRMVQSVEEAGEAVHGTTGLGVWKEICEYWYLIQLMEGTLGRPLGGR